MKDLSQAEKQDLLPVELLQYFFAEILEDHDPETEKTQDHEDRAPVREETSLLQFF